ncbi:MAG: hypothetical protein EOP06_16965 [Proteobacteria bacterium]|nr:MAG: hypothetical protein EOP06_16965 [Pseudomonadota bacterium]
MEHEKMLGEVSSVIVRYKPMEFNLGAEATSADLAHLEMTYHRDSGAKELKAYFSVGRQDKHLRVLFPNVDIFRVIDDMHRPMEEHGSEQVGHVSNYFAYTVQGSPFCEAQRETFEILLPGSTHYLFVTGGDCLDVITREEPQFRWVVYAAQ